MNAMADGSLRVAVLGTGAAATALACRAGARGHRVRLWGRPGAGLARLTRRGTLTLREPDGTRTDLVPDHIGSDPEKVVSGADAVVVAVSSTAQTAVLEHCAGALGGDQVVYLVPGHTGGLWTARETLPPGSVIAETFLPFVCRDTPGGVAILQDKRHIDIAVRPEEWERTAVERARALGWPVGAPLTPLETGLRNMTVVFQPALALCNAARIDAGEAFAVYRDGMTPAAGRLCGALDRERLAVAAAYGVRVPTAAEWIRRAYGGRGDDLCALLRSVEGYRTIAAPSTLDHRFLREHVQAGHVPLAGLARRAGVPVPTVEAVIALASALLGEDLRATGRDLTRFAPDGDLAWFRAA